MNEIVTFEKWVSQEFGPDMNKQIYENGYLNFGSMKSVFEHVYKNLYSSKFARLVKLNLNSDKNVFSLCQGDNEELNALKIKELELDKKLSLMSLKLVEKENEKIKLVKHINQISANISSSESDIINKYTGLSVEEAGLKKTKLIESNFREANEKLSALAESAASVSYSSNNLDAHQSINEAKRNEIEHLLHAFKQDNLSINSSVIENGKKKLNKLPLNTFLKCLEGKIQDETSKLSQILDESNLAKEINLLVYQEMAGNQFLFENSYGSIGGDQNLDLRNVINQTFMECITRESEIVKFGRDTQRNEQETLQIQSRLNEFFKSQYSGAEFQLYGRYLRSLLALKRKEINFRELKKCCDQSEQEIARLNQNCSHLVYNNKQIIYELINLIHQNQIQMDCILSENMDFFTTKFLVEFNHLKQAKDALFESVRSLNNQLIINTDPVNKNEISCLYSSFMTAPSNPGAAGKRRADIKARGDSNLLEDCVKLQPLESYLKFDTNFKSRAFLFSELINHFNTLLRLCNKSASRSGGGDYDSSSFESMSSELNSLIEQCRSADRDLIKTYLAPIKAKTNELDKHFKECGKIENMLNIWWSQPGANECILDTFTVNAKNLDYYLRAINDAIVKTTSNRKYNY